MCHPKFAAWSKMVQPYLLPSAQETDAFWPNIPSSGLLLSSCQGLAAGGSPIAVDESCGASDRFWRWQLLEQQKCKAPHSWKQTGLLQFVFGAGGGSNTKVINVDHEEWMQLISPGTNSRSGTKTSQGTQPNSRHLHLMSPKSVVLDNRWAQAILVADRRTTGLQSKAVFRRRLVA